MILLGILHQVDLEGPKRMQYFLEKCRPKKISLEWPDSYTIKETAEVITSKISEELRYVQSLNVPPVIRQYLEEQVKTKGYELMVPIRFKSENKDFEICFVDHPSVAALLEHSFFEEGKVSDYENLPPGKVQELMRTPYSVFRKSMVGFIDRAYFNMDVLDTMLLPSSTEAPDEELEAFEGVFEEGFEEIREEHMAENIIEASPDAHIGGIMHIFEPTIITVKPLFARLQEKNIPIGKIRLCEVAKYF